jgi:acetyl-CoA/propionyl-CoA carboxylase, biotin carboxylase, biotin carboxyl carrier protein
MQGTVVKVAVSEGDLVDAGDLIVVLEAMKMENPVIAHQPGTITALAARPGTPVTQGTALCQITQHPAPRYGDISGALFKTPYN